MKSSSFGMVAALALGAGFGGMPFGPTVYTGPEQRSNGTLPASEAKRIIDHDKKCRKGTRAKFRKNKKGPTP